MSYDEDEVVDSGFRIGGDSDDEIRDTRGYA